MSASTGSTAAGCKPGAEVWSSRNTTLDHRIVGGGAFDDAAVDFDVLGAQQMFCWLPPLMRSTTGRSNTSETRSGAAGVPRTLDCASFQLTTMFGACPGSAMVSGPWNSLISKVG